MTEQTRCLVQSLPKFASLFESADRVGGFEWKIVRWEGIPPGEIQPDQVRIMMAEDLNPQVEENSFRSRTRALVASAQIVRSTFDRSARTEQGHWGVWKIRENGHAYYQSVMPIGRNPGLVSRSAPASGLSLPVGERDHDLLKRWSAEDGRGLEDTLSAAIKEYDRQRFFEKADEAYRRLRADRGAWEEELREREELDGTLLDDIELDEDWGPDGLARVRLGKERRSV